MSIIDENGINLDKLYAAVVNGNRNVEDEEKYVSIYIVPFIRYAIVSLNYDAVAYLHSGAVRDIIRTDFNKIINELKEYGDSSEYTLIWRLFQDGYFKLVQDNSVKAKEIFETDLNILEPRLAKLEFQL